MKPANKINALIASKYLKRPELTGFLDFLYPSLKLQFCGFINELCYQSRLLIAPYVRSAIFEFTNCCNLKCILCPHSTGEMRKTGFMDFERFKNVIEANPGLDLVQCNGWGETFLHPDAIKFIRFAKSKGKRVYLYSNGTKIDNTLADEIIKSGLDRIVISLDGVDDTYERIRGYSYSKIEDRILTLIKRKNEMDSSLIIDVSMVGSKETEKDINEFKNRWKSKVNRVQVLSYFNHTAKLRHSRCRELWRGNPMILWNGDVSVCCVDWEGALTFAKIGPDGYNLEQIWNCKRMKELRSFHIRKKFPSICNHCNEYSSDIVTNRFGE